ncbi:hypothetical protein ACN20G_17195 [Streptomyces sp. BI20]|uniref:hypothetical protein n=1 Tax=Streptomyces sp. BI20 TaxID=3403460 RepID=UPI003C785DE5
MGRGIVHALAWLLATAAAVTLSWWGVRTVMSGTAYDPPQALPLSGVPLTSSTHDARPSAPAPSAPASSPAASPSPSRSASASVPARGPAASRTPSARVPVRPTPEPGPDGGVGGGGGTAQGHRVSGGQVVFDMGPSSARLVSATPEAGWTMRVWKTDTWIRVVFTRDGREVSVFCTWHDHPPLVEIVDP